MPAKYDEIQKKLDSGKELTESEIKAVMSMPNNKDTKEFYPETEEEKEIDWDSAEEIGGDDTKEDKDKKDGENNNEEKANEKTKSGDDEGNEKRKEGENNETSVDGEIKSETDDIDIDEIRATLDIADSDIDISKWDSKKKSIYWEMKRERRLRQQAEQERDLLRLDKLRRDKAPEKEEDAIPGDDDDFVTKGDLKKIRDSQKKSEEPAAVSPIYDPASPLGKRFLALCEKEAGALYDDFQEVAACADDILSGNEIYVKQLAKSYTTGENPLIVAYNLVKGDPKFPAVYAAVKARISAGKAGQQKKVDEKELMEQVKRNEKKIEENEKKPKTSGHHSNSDSENEGVTMNSILKMSDSEFAKIPKKKREAILRKFGA